MKTAATCKSYSKKKYCSPLIVLPNGQVKSIHAIKAGNSKIFMYFYRESKDKNTC
ncbi:hypothetical protein IQ31_05034 [Sphingobacterium siyangense]|uniref:Uncharacterized protein n=1 Tax=Sphingobacterium siyangense TaxID=459529 RepID=A0A562M6H3_9SPHI|nr:hypothetical protein IQ31_05034 [Sphingobacterium siyangense]